MVAETEKKSVKDYPEGADRGAESTPAVEFIDVVKYFGEWGQRHRVL
ncbi:hypothetical protein VU00_11251, partial [Candidatus Electrothrix marina]